MPRPRPIGRKPRSGHEKIETRLQRRSANGASAGLEASDFVQVGSNGLGDPQNSYAFSMAWFNDCLYVGTARNLFALIGASPPKHAAALKPWPVPQPKDIFTTDLRAQIWRYSADERLRNRWCRVYRSPLVHGSNGDRTPRDIGYRNMAVFRRPDDRRALYVATASSNTRGPGAHILRYTESDDVVAVSKPGFGDQNVSTFRTLTGFNGRLYSSPTGDGRAWNAASHPSVYETDNPMRGRWRRVSLPNFGDFTNDALYSMAAFNDHLYVGTLNPTSGYQVWKTPAKGTPYKWTKVVDGGAGRGNFNEAVVTMCLFKGALYVGSGVSNGGYDRTYQIGPAAGEVIRIHPDDSWDLVVGEARDTADGYKFPLSGMGPGFDNPFAGYIWSMAAHDGWLYVGTFDSAIFTLWADPQRQSLDQRIKLRLMGVENFVQERAGFELWRSNDGIHWTSVTQNGFGNPYNYGVRTMMSTPIGLFIGTANPFGPEVATKLASGWRYLPNPQGGAEVWLGLTQRPHQNADASTAVAKSGPTRGDPIFISDSEPLVRRSGGPLLNNPGPGRDFARTILTTPIEEIEGVWRTAALQATDASFKYHLIRLLSAVARRAMVSVPSPDKIPQWALEMRRWEGNLSGGASQRAGIEAFVASRNYHLASARREKFRWSLAESPMEKAASWKKYRQHLKNAQRASRRLRRALIRNRRDLMKNAPSNGDQVANSSLAAHINNFYDRKIYDNLPFDWLGDNNFVNFGFWFSDTRTRREASENLMEQILAYIPRKKGKILDVACGKGATTKYLLNYYRPQDLTAINISETQLEICRQNVPRCKFFKMDATKLSFADDSFDAVISVEAAFHFNTREQFLREAYRVLRPGGHLVLSDILFTKQAEWLSPLFVFENHLETLDQYEALLRHVGFEDVKVNDVTRQTWEAHLEYLMRYLNEKLQTGEITVHKFKMLMRNTLLVQVPSLRFYVLVGARKP